MIFDREIPAKDELWTRYDGKVFKILDVSFHSNVSGENIKHWAVEHWATETETEKLVAVHILGEGVVIWDGSKQLPEYVVYQEDGDNTLYVTSVHHFMEILGEGTDHYYRFTKVALIDKINLQIKMNNSGI